jgi:hypothetical protein
MVLVQEDDSFSEYVIYYLSRGLVGPELNYSHIEKLVLAAVHAVQRFYHYVLFRKTTIIVVVKPFQYMLTRRVIGGKISRWIIILQEFDLEFVSANSKKSLVFTDLFRNFRLSQVTLCLRNRLSEGICFLLHLHTPGTEIYLSISRL